MSILTDRPIWRPYTQEKIAPLPIEIDRAAGSYLFTKSGRKIFDGISSWWVITHGHCHPRIVEAIQRQAARIDQVIFANFSHNPAEELSEQLLRLTPPKLRRVFFSDNGSTAVEVALKMAYQWWVHRGEPHKRDLIDFTQHVEHQFADAATGDFAFEVLVNLAFDRTDDPLNLLLADWPLVAGLLQPRADFFAIKRDA